MNSSIKNGSQTNSRFDNKNNENLQQQTFKDSQIQAQAQAEIQYYIYQDLQNIINLIQSRKAVLEHFKNDPNHGMITQSNNKLILQLNLSNAIHSEQQQIYKEQPQLIEFLQKERNKAYEILEKIIDNNDQLLNSNQNNDYFIPYYLQKYKLRYAKQEFKLEDQFPLQDTNQVAKFDEGVLQNMISSISNVDNQIQQIRMNKSYRVPDPNEIQLKANDYYKKTSYQLKENFPISKLQVNQMKKENSMPSNQTSYGTQNNVINEKQELINYLIFSGFFNDQTNQCNSYNKLQEWISLIKDELIINYNQQQNWIKDLYLYIEYFELHCKFYYFISIYLEYQSQSNRINEIQKISQFNTCIQKNREQLKMQIKNFFEYLRKNQELIRKNQKQQGIFWQDSGYIYELYQRVSDKRN